MLRKFISFPLSLQYFKEKHKSRSASNVQQSNEEQETFQAIKSTCTGYLSPSHRTAWRGSEPSSRGSLSKPQSIARLSVRIVLFSNAQLAGVVFYWEQDGTVSVMKCNRWRLLYGRICNHCSVAHLHVTL